MPGDSFHSNKFSDEETNLARAFPFIPDSDSIVTRISIPEGREFSEAQRSLDLIASLHGQRGLPRIVVEVDTDVPGLAAYVFDEATGRALSIGLHPDMDYDAVDFAHEIGHFVHAWGFAPTGRYTTLEEGLLAELGRALRSSTAVQHLQNLQGLNTSFYSGRNYLIDAATVNYLLLEHEIFARAYAQYVAVSSGDALMLESVSERTHTARHPLLYSEQWNVQDFEPIALAFDRLFLELLWIQPK